MPSARDIAVRIAMQLREKGFEALLAGGCVRDEALGREPRDWDVATTATPEDVRVLFKGAHCVGESFGVMLVRRGGFTTEVATFRVDGPSADHRRPDRVEFSDARHDAQRRDFTINGLFQDPETEAIIDHVGGLDDLKQRIIRAIGRPGDRFDEDHLRMLRAVRFAAMLDFRIEDATAAAIREHAGALSGVSRERVGDEFRRMLMHPCAVSAMGLLASMQLDQHVLNRALGGSMQHLAATVDKAMDWPARLAGLALDCSVDADGVRDAWTGLLMLSNSVRDNACRVLDAYEGLSDWDAMTMAQQRRLLGSAQAGDAVVLRGVRHAEQAAAIDKALVQWTALPGGVLPPRLLGGQALLDAGVKAGPELGILLEKLYDAQLEASVATEPQARALLSQLRESTS
jgi:hypothetical protein